jgi:mono/diheme cytochrome c family protein
MVCLFAEIGTAGQAVRAISGEAGSKQYCLVCHPNGGNTITPQKTLYVKNLDANHIRKAKDIIMVARKAAPGMPVLDKNTLPDEEAMEIAKYTLKTLKSGSRSAQGPGFSDVQVFPLSTLIVSNSWVLGPAAFSGGKWK